MIGELIVRAPFGINSGYKTLIDTVVSGLSEHNVKIYTKNLNEISKTDDILELCILPVNINLKKDNILYSLPNSKKRIIFTMWESTVLPENVVDYFNTNSGIILPNEWNLTNFKTNGVNVPIKKCPLFVDTNKFYYKTPNDSPIFVFGSGNADPRKKTNNVIRSFCRTFPPDIKNVKLKIKIERCDLPFLNSFSDKRIEVLTKHLSKTELSDWYHNLDVFISGATSEGWGFMQHEAMSCGRPVISVDYGGVKEFFNSSVGIIVKHTEVVAENQWGTAGGFWSKYDEIDMINKIKWCYENRKTIHDIGILSSIKAQKFDIPNFIYNLITILNEFDMYC